MVTNTWVLHYFFGSKLSTLGERLPTSAVYSERNSDLG